MAKSAN